MSHSFRPAFSQGRFPLAHIDAGAETTTNISSHYAAMPNGQNFEGRISTMASNLAYPNYTLVNAVHVSDATSSNQPNILPNLFPQFPPNSIHRQADIRANTYSPVSPPSTFSVPYLPYKSSSPIKIPNTTTGLPSLFSSSTTSHDSFSSTNNSSDDDEEIRDGDEPAGLDNINCSDNSIANQRRPQREGYGSYDSTLSTVPYTYREKRREAHTQAEQKRRDGIKRGYQRLQDVLPQSFTQDSTLAGQKVSKAIVLQKSIEYVDYLVSSRNRQEEQLTTLQKELTGLRIMKENYEKMTRLMMKADGIGRDAQGEPAVLQVSDSVKFQVFQHVMEELFESFDVNVNPSSFAELSGSGFSWLEEYCKPQQMHRIVAGVLDDLRSSTNIGEPGGTPYGYS